MKARQIIECVPNFSEGRDLQIIADIRDAMASVAGVTVLDVDPGKATNRTVMTMVGAPDDVIEAAFRGIKKAAETIDMRTHEGAHPRMGATDVCPLIPIANTTMEECVSYAQKLGQRVGDELGISVYLYESAASKPERKNLATVRAGEYEGMAKKIAQPEWKPDYGPTTLNAQAGVTAIGARDFLVAYNVNLNTKSIRRANSIAFDVREKGRVQREGNPVTGTIVRDAEGQPLRAPGMCKAVKAIGWYIDEYDIAQISMNLTDLKQTNIHEAFEACRTSANKRNLRVTGSELIGLLPKKVLLDAGKYYLEAQNRSTGIPEKEIIHIAIRSLGLDDLAPFDPQKKIIEYAMEESGGPHLVDLSLTDFANETSSESMAPGGGSISAAVGSLGAALSSMVANLSANKKGWDDKVPYFSKIAQRAQLLQSRLLFLVDEDTRSFNKIIDAIRLPKSNEAEKSARHQAIQEATKYAIQTPFEILKNSYDIMELAKEMVTHGMDSSVTDAAVSAACARAAITGAYFNVFVNCLDVDDQAFVDEYLGASELLLQKSEPLEAEIREAVIKKLKGETTSDS